MRNQLLVLLLVWSLVSTSAVADDSAPAKVDFNHDVVLVTGQPDERMRAFDELMISFVREHHVPGAALAVADGDRLVYARGFGFSDVQAKSPVMPTSLFRIASISKPITAVAVLQLVERGELRLDERVFDILEIEPHFNGDSRELDPRLEQITVQQCLQHTAGWDRDESFDPMFRSVRIARALGTPPPAAPDAIIRFMRARPLDFNPGERYAYSNFGYSLLGRIIEQRSGRTYEQFVRENVLEPLAIQRPRIGHTRERSAFEVRYYDEHSATGRSVFADSLNERVPTPYGAWYLEAMDAHGGWLASAVDLVRFAAGVHSQAAPQLLGPEMTAKMLERPAGLAGTSADGEPLDAYYGCGWMVRPIGEGMGVNAWHTGSLPGTSTLLVSRHDGRHWAVLFNTRSNPNDKYLSGIIDPLLHEAADAVTEWPAEDQFSTYIGRE